MIRITGPKHARDTCMKRDCSPAHYGSREDTVGKRAETIGLLLMQSATITADELAFCLPDSVGHKATTDRRAKIRRDFATKALQRLVDVGAAEKQQRGRKLHFSLARGAVA